MDGEFQIKLRERNRIVDLINQQDRAPDDLYRSYYGLEDAIDDQRCAGPKDAAARLRLLLQLDREGFEIAPPGVLKLLAKTADELEAM